MLPIAQYVECLTRIHWNEQINTPKVSSSWDQLNKTHSLNPLPLGMELQFKDPLLQLHCNFRFLFFPLSWLRNVWKNKTFYLCCGLFSFILKNTKHSEKSGETITHICEHVTHLWKNPTLFYIWFRSDKNEMKRCTYGWNSVSSSPLQIPSTLPRSLSNHRFCYLEHSWASFYTSSTQICLCPSTNIYQCTCLQRFHKWYTAAVPL